MNCQDFDKEREEMHASHLKLIERKYSLWEYEDLMVFELEELSNEKLQRRIKLGWLLGRMANLKLDIDYLISNDNGLSTNGMNGRLYGLINFEDQSPSEYLRNWKMLNVLHDYYLSEDKVKTALEILKIKTAASLSIGKTKAFKKDAKLLLSQIESDSEMAFFVKRYMGRRLWLCS